MGSMFLQAMGSFFLQATGLSLIALEVRKTLWRLSTSMPAESSKTELGWPESLSLYGVSEVDFFKNT